MRKSAAASCESALHDGNQREKVPENKGKRFQMAVGITLRRRFGENIRQLRLSRGLTQEGLAEKSDLSVDAVRRIEWGTISPSLDTLSKLANGLDISLRTLFSTFEQRKRDDVAELSDFLSRRSSKDARLVARLVKVLFEG
jgi:transcriptional regulator with XRE-family HTH domain